MTDRDETEGTEECGKYWKRKQSAKRNRFGGEAVVAPPDRDADSAENYNFKGGSAPPKGTKSSTIWDDE